jgi:hypothetical protein
MCMASLGEAPVVTEQMRLYAAQRVYAAVAEALAPLRKEIADLKERNAWQAKTLSEIELAKQPSPRGGPLTPEELRRFLSLPLPVEKYAESTKRFERSAREAGPGIEKLPLKPAPLVASEEWVSEWDLLPDAE